MVDYVLNMSKFASKEELVRFSKRMYAVSKLAGEDYQVRQALVETYVAFDRYV